MNYLEMMISGMKRISEWKGNGIVKIRTSEPLSAIFFSFSSLPDAQTKTQQNIVYSMLLANDVCVYMCLCLCLMDWLYTTVDTYIHTQNHTQLGFPSSLFYPAQFLFLSILTKRAKNTLKPKMIIIIFFNTMKTCVCFSFFTFYVFFSPSHSL